MKEWLKGKKIKDEYGDDVSYDDFWKMVAAKQTKENLNHAEYVYKTKPHYMADSEHVIDGYSFSDCEFS